jgi:hypothetical protein
MRRRFGFSSRKVVRRNLNSIAAALICTVAGAGTLPVRGAVSTNGSSDWTVSLGVGVRETFDSNVFLQSETERANHASMITSLLPVASLGWKPNTKLGVTASYSPEAHFFHSESSENHFVHRGALTLAGAAAPVSYDVNATAVRIDGSSIAPTWTGPGGAPATGGPVVRDRRDAAVYRATARMTWKCNDWFLRPVTTLYVHDFQTEQRSLPGYQNYVDRREATVGADLGYYLRPQLGGLVGYRFGAQEQAGLLSFPEHYDSTFHRVLLGLEGQTMKWLKLSLMTGPEFRSFEDSVAAGFGDRDKINFFVEGTATFTLSKADTLTVLVKRFEQPGSSGRGTCQDFTTDLSWRHRVGERWTCGLGVRGYNTQFRQPVKRDDWVVSANALVNFAFDRHWGAECSYVCERGLTRNDNASGREYQRHLVALGIKYSFL